MHPDDYQYYADMALHHGMSIDDYIKYEEGLLPPITDISDVFNNPPELAPEAISGVLRKGHKMLFTGGSKVGKTWAMMGLAIAFASGSEWFGNWCKKSKVLYINMEVDDASCIDRFIKIANHKGIKLEQIEGHLSLWNLRGKSAPLAEMSQKIVERAVGEKYDAVIIDPIYKLQGGDENNAGDIGKFTNELDKIATKMGASVIYAHHHTKGAQGAKKAIDRAAGSGVFARDADAMVDVLELEEIVHPDKRAFKVEFTTREFMTPPDKYVWFEFPCFREDPKIYGELMEEKEADQALKEEIKEQKRLAKEKLKEENKEKLATSRAYKREAEIKKAFDKLDEGKGVDAKVLAEHMGTVYETLRRWLKESISFDLKKGVVITK